MGFAMARFPFHLSVIYCGIVLLITTVSTDLQNFPNEANIKSSTQPGEVIRGQLRPITSHLSISSNSSAAGRARAKSVGSFDLIRDSQRLSNASDGEPAYFQTHSSPPATSFKSFSNPQLMAEPEEGEFHIAEAEGRSGLRLSTRPTLSTDNILQLGNMFEPFKGPRRRRRRRRSPAVNNSGQKVYYAYTKQGQGPVSNQNAVQNSKASQKWRPTVGNIESHRPTPLKASSFVETFPMRNGNPPLATLPNIAGSYQHLGPANNTEFVPIPNQAVEAHISTHALTPPIQPTTFHHQVRSPSYGAIDRFADDPVPPDVVIWNRNGDPYTEQEIQAMLQNAMTSAWAQYGPGSKPPTYYKYNPVQSSKRQSPILLSPNFQPVHSEWDKDMTETPNRHEVLQPGLFNRILSTYIDFEVNNHELADLMRKIVVGFGVGIIIVAWVLLGLWIGLLPYKLMLLKKRDVEGKDYDDSSDSHHATSRNSIIRDITENVYLALDGDWLKKLEETVTKNSDSRWLKTNVHCCILPDANTKGMAECQVIRKGRNDSTFKCLSDLIYDFQFGPSHQPSS